MLLEWRLKRIRMREQKKLSEKNLALYKSMTVYIQNSDLNGREKEEVLQQIMDILLQCQVENKPVDMFIGEDYEVFCRSIIKEYDSGKSKIYKALNYLQKYLIWVLLIAVIMAVVNVIFEQIDFSVTLRQFVFASYFALFIVPMSRKARQTNAYTPFLHRIYINRDERIVSLLLAGFLMVVFNFVIGRIFGQEVFLLSFGLYNMLPYMAFALILVGAIEVYRRVYDRR